jgi:hypothetical protein
MISRTIVWLVALSLILGLGVIFACGDDDDDEVEGMESDDDDDDDDGDDDDDDDAADDDDDNADDHDTCNTVLWDVWNIMGCTDMTTESPFTLDADYMVNWAMIWVDTNLIADPESIAYELTGPSGAVQDGDTYIIDCDDGQPNWCMMAFEVDAPLVAGDYMITVDTAAICSNADSGMLGFSRVYGCDE